jgi:periplasmic protein TonB
MADNVLISRAAPQAPRTKYRPPLGLPLRRDGRWGDIVSLVVHALIVLLVLAPLFEHDVKLVAMMGAGGAGPVGGGGGGHRGTGGQDLGERLRFFSTAPAPQPASPPLASPQPAKPVIPPPPAPPEPQLPVVAAVDVPALPTTAPVVGTGGGTGNDGTGGTGPGTGGGVGTGIGTGKGSGAGPGSGGEGGKIYPATSDYAIMPLMDKPASVRGKKLKLSFSIDERGKVLRVEFESTGDRSYDKQLRAKLLEYRFRPAHTLDGTPVPWVYEIEMEL